MTLPLAFVRSGPDELRSAGSGRPIVLVHGWMCDSADMAALQSELPRDRITLAVDLRGHGRSVGEFSDYSMSSMADDLAALCSDQKLSDVLIIGHSMGGAVAIEAAVRHPDLVAGVVLVDSPWVFVSPAPETIAGAAELRTNAFAGRRDRLLAARRTVHRADTVLTGAEQDPAAESFASLMSWPGPERLSACTRPIAAQFSDGSWPQVQAIFSDAQTNPHPVDVTHIVGTGHWIQAERPEIVAEIALRFDSSVDPLR